MLSGSVPHLTNGVSRQVDAMRLPTHLEQQINRLSSPATGNQKRPPIEHIKEITSASFSGSMFYHPINRDSLERYHVLIKSGDLYVFDKNGNQKTVAFPDGKAYLSAGTANARQRFFAATSADYTFIGNKDVTVAMDAATSPTRPVEALVWVKAAGYAKTYTIRINGSIVAQVQTPDGADDQGYNSDKEQQAVQANEIAKALFWGGIVNGKTRKYGTATGSPLTWTWTEVTEPGTINGWTTANGDGSLFADYSGENDPEESKITTRLIDNLNPSTWNITRYGNVLAISRVDGANFRISVESDRSGVDAIECVKDTVNSFDELPNRGPEGFVVQVRGDRSTGADDYWVQIQKKNANDQEQNVNWKETVKPNTTYKLDASTMPHILVRESSGDFTFKRATWTDRKVGDNSINPSFVGSTLNDCRFHRGRLAFLSSESVVMSRPTLFFNLFRTTLTSLLDDDPIDVAGTSDNVAIFRHGIPFNDDFLLWSDQSIHRMTSGDLLSPKNVALPTATAAQIDIDVKPVATSKSILFKGTALSYTDIREAYIAPDTDEILTSSVSDHVMNYLPATVDRIVASDVVNMAVASTNNANANLFVYQYYWAGNEKLQAAWHKWETAMTGTNLGTVFWDDELHIVTRENSETLKFSKIKCSAQVQDSGQTFAIRLDRRLLSTELTFADGPGYTMFVLPDTYNTATVECYRWGGTGHGLPVKILSTTSNTVTIDRTEYTGTVVFGYTYDSYVELSRLYVREPKGDREVITDVSPFRIKRLFIHFQDTATAFGKVTPYFDAATGSKEFCSSLIDDNRAQLDRVNLLTSSLSLPVKARSDRAKIVIENNTAYPDTITGFEWEGEYDPRAKRI
jgi:hypothetical protein